MFSPSDQDILRALIAERGSAVIPTGGVGTAVSISGGGLPVNPAQTNFIASPANYKIDPRGNRMGDTMLDIASGYGDLYADMKSGWRPGMKNAQRGARRGFTKIAGRGGRRLAGKAGAAIGALPGMGALGTAAKVLGPAAAAGGALLGVGDIIYGQDSATNKAMDATAMTIGGFLGSVGGPLGAAAGAGLGKMASDATQFVFGGGKSAEERRMEEALAMLQGGRF